MLRTLAAHPRLHVVHQIFEPDDPRDLALFRLLKQRKKTSIKHDHPALAHRDIREDSALILKNAVWVPDHEYPGFILVRHPFSVMTSARVVNETEKGKITHIDQIQRWTRGIAPDLRPIMRLSDTLTGFCLLFERKMSALHATGLPIVHYERFIEDPARVLKRLLPKLGVEWDERVLKAHKQYEQGALGHGRIKLWKPIHKNSTEKYKDMPAEDFARIAELCGKSLELYGYEVTGNEVSLRDDVDCRM